MKASVMWLIDNGCELAKPSVGVLLGIYDRTNGEPCKDCACKQTCPAYPKLTAVKSHGLCSKCRSLLNPVKVARRGGKCACGHQVAG